MATTTTRFIADNGLDNNSKSIVNLGTTGATLAIAGANQVVLTTTGPTVVTLPVTGTLTTTVGSVSTVTAPAQPAITSVGTLTGLTVSGTITGSISGNAATATSISAGVANQILIQTAPNTTSFVAAPTVSGTVLNWNGSSLNWVTPLLPSAIGITVQGYDINTAKISVAQTWTAQQTPYAGSLTDATTVSWDGNTNGQVVALTLTAARTMGAPTNIRQNALYVLVMTTGGFTPSWNTAYKWATVPIGLEVATYTFSFIGGASNTLIPMGAPYKTGA